MKETIWIGTSQCSELVGFHSKNATTNTHIWMKLVININIGSLINHWKEFERWDLIPWRITWQKVWKCSKKVDLWISTSTKLIGATAVYGCLPDFIEICKYTWFWRSTMDRAYICKGIFIIGATFFIVVVILNKIDEVPLNCSWTEIRMGSLVSSPNFSTSQNIYWHLNTAHL